MIAQPLRQIGTILSSKVIAQNCREIQVSWQAPNPMPIPGQFFTILPECWPILSLRRPFAYSGTSPNEFTFVCEIRGSVSSHLASLKAGHEIDWIGPLGRGFPMPSAGNNPILVAGGVGVGPIFYLAQELVRLNTKPLVVLGAQNKNVLPQLSWPADTEVQICTEDGSAGIAGTVLDGLKKYNITQGIFYSCGPWAMMKAIHLLSVQKKCPSWISVEEIMACGVGTCQSCAVPNLSSKENKYKRTCMEGPVFASQELNWKEIQWI